MAWAVRKAMRRAGSALWKRPVSARSSEVPSGGRSHTASRSAAIVRRVHGLLDAVLERAGVDVAGRVVVGQRLERRVPLLLERLHGTVIFPVRRSGVQTGPPG